MKGKKMLKLSIQVETDQLERYSYAFIEVELIKRTFFNVDYTPT